METLAESVWGWIRDNGQALEGIGSIGALTIIFLTARQVADAAANQDVSTALQFVRTFEDELTRWSDAEVGDREKQLGRLVGSIEVGATLVNYKRLSKATNYLVRHHIKDALSVIVDESDASPVIQDWMTDPEVCRQVRLFLIENYALVRRRANYSKVYATFFVGRKVMFEWDDGPLGASVRFVYAKRLRWRFGNIADV